MELRADFRSYLATNSNAKHILRATPPEFPVTITSEKGKGSYKSRKEYVQSAYRLNENGDGWLFNGRMVVAQDSILDVILLAFTACEKRHVRGLHTIHGWIKSRYHGVLRRDITKFLELRRKYEHFNMEVGPGNLYPRPNGQALSSQPEEIGMPGDVIVSGIVPYNSHYNIVTVSAAAAISLRSKASRSLTTDQHSPPRTDSPAISVDNLGTKRPLLQAKDTGWQEEWKAAGSLTHSTRRRMQQIHDFLSQISGLRKIVVIVGAGISVAAGSMLT